MKLEAAHIVVGRATVPAVPVNVHAEVKQHSGCWALPGGLITSDMELATRVAWNINELMLKRVRTQS